MAKSYRTRKYTLFNNKRRSGNMKHKSTKKHTSKYSTRTRTRTRSRRGGNEIIRGLSTPIYSNKFGSTHAIEAAKRSNQGAPNANPFGSQALISTTLPTMSKQ
jgi:predicted choloylglycine hydrolase